MLNELLRELIDRNVLITVATTGGGAGAQDLLWGQPSASSYLSGAVFPYAREESDALVGFELGRYACRDAALHLAMAAYMKSCETLELRTRRRESDLGKLGKMQDAADRWKIDEFAEAGAAALIQADIKKLGACTPVGVALTASLSTSVEHRGDHRALIAVITPTVVRETEIFFPKDQGRGVDGLACNRLIVNAIFEALGMDQDPMWTPFAHLYGGDIESVHDAPSHYRHIILKPRNAPETEVRALFLARPYFSASGQRTQFVMSHSKYNLVPVTGNPLHEAHVGMAQALEELTDHRSIFLVAANPPPSNGTYKKPGPTVQDMLRRAAMVRASNRLYGAERSIFFSESPLFVDIAKRHPDTGIAVGSDAMLRALDPSWLGGEEATAEQFATIHRLGTRFWVFDRPSVTLEQVREQASKLLGSRTSYDLIRPVGKALPSVSSTEIRKLRGWA